MWLHAVFEARTRGKRGDENDMRSSTGFGVRFNSVELIFRTSTPNLVGYANNLGMVVTGKTK